MASDENEIIAEVDSFYRLYKSGHVERFYDIRYSFYIPPSPQHPINGAFSKDITISQHVSARFHLPENISNPQKIPVLIYYHGGGFVMESTFFYLNHNYVNSLASELKVVVVSVEYRLAPEVGVPTIYEDCWTALQWVASHADENSSNTNNKDSWLMNFCDFSKVFVVGDSVGGNLVYHMTMRAGKESLNNDMKISGSILAYPYFLFPNIEIDKEGFAYKNWVNICPPLEPELSSPIDSPLINPLSEKAPSLSGLGCSRILVCVGKKDVITPLEIGVLFVQSVKESGWDGELEYHEFDDELVFQTYKPQSEEAKRMMKCYANFVHH